MTERPPRRRVARGSAPGLLTNAAREAFAELGYGATTREIATRAGVSHDLIFRYFETKEKLFFDAVAAPLLDAVDGMRRHWLDRPQPNSMDPDQLVRRFTEDFYEFISANQSIARAMVHLFVGGSTEGELARLRMRISETLAPMVSPMDDYFAAKGLRHSSPALQLRLVMLLVGAVATFLPNTYASDEDVPDSDAVIVELAHVIARGLRDE